MVALDFVRGPRDALFARTRVNDRFQKRIKNQF